MRDWQIEVMDMHVRVICDRSVELIDCSIRSKLVSGSIREGVIEIQDDLPAFPRSGLTSKCLDGSPNVLLFFMGGDRDTDAKFAFGSEGRDLMGEKFDKIKSRVSIVTKMLRDSIREGASVTI
jgi:hypothetical protein